MDFLRENSTGIITRSRRDNLIANLATPSLCLIHPGSTVPCLLNGQAHQPAKPAPGGVAFRNGILNVESMVEEQPAGAFAPTSPEIFITNPRPYEFNPSAECPKFLTFLEEVLPDPDVRGLVQEAAGLLQVVDTRFEVFFLFVGEGGNGKSTFLRVLRKVLGDSNVSDIPLRSFSDKFRLISLTRSLANIVTESIERFGQHRVVEDVLKAVVSGEEITVEEKFKGAYSAPATARIVVAANELPLITDRTQGVWRRAVIVPFDITIPEDHQNRNLAKEIIEAEVPGVFNWALQGYLRLRCRGHFDAPAACREAVRRHRLRCAPERQFFQLHVKPGSDSDFASVSEIYAAYQTCARANGYQGAMNVGSFSIALQREFKGATKTMRRVDGTNTRGYAGVVFEPNGVEDVEDVE
jgi:putative DNA primase/helicase